MTMKFREIKTAIETVLSNAAGSNYRVVGYQTQADSAIENLDGLRSVQVFYDRGEMNKSGGSLPGPFKHDMMFRLELVVAKDTKGDLATLNSSDSTDSQRATALATFQKAAKLADDALDELIDLVFQAIQDARRIDFDLADPIANRWVSDIQKNEPSERGELVILTASMILTCSANEAVSGETAQNVDAGGTVQPTTIDVDLIVNDDTNEGKAGVEQENPAP